MGAVLVQIVAYLAVCVFVWRVVVPQVQDVLASPFRNNALARLKKRKYLVSYISLRLIAALVTAANSYASQGAQQGHYSAGTTLGLLLRSCSLIVLLMWALEFFSLGRAGLFRELYLTNTTVQEIVKPFFWVLLGTMAVVSIVCMPFTLVQLYHISPPAAWPLILFSRLGGNFMYLALIFNMATRGCGVPRTLLNILGVLILTVVVNFALMGIESLLGVNTMVGAIFHMVQSYPKSLQQAMSVDHANTAANQLMANLLIGKFLYWRFETASPEVWVPREDR